MAPCLVFRTKVLLLSILVKGFFRRRGFLGFVLRRKEAVELLGVYIGGGMATRFVTAGDLG